MISRTRPAPKLGAGMVYGLELVYNFGDTVRERGGLGVLFGSAIMAAGSAGWLDSHPSLAQRVQRIYGRNMGPLPLTPAAAAVQAHVF